MTGPQQPAGEFLSAARAALDKIGDGHGLVWTDATLMELLRVIAALGLVLPYPFPSGSCLSDSLVLALGEVTGRALRAISAHETGRQAAG